MIPKHQRLVDDLLKRIHPRVDELVRQCAYPVGRKPEEPAIEQLRESLLGQHLAAIAQYAESYPYPYTGDVRGSVNFVARCLYGDPLTTQGFRLPAKWQRSELGGLVHTAVLRFYEEERPGQLLTVTEMRKRFEVKRQTVHQWVEDGLLFAIYKGDTPLFYVKDVERFQQRRTQKSVTK
jgi:hypothetical protein